MHRGVVDTPLPEHLVDQSEGAAVGVVRNHDVIAGAQDGPQCAVRGTHPGTEGPAEPALFDRGQNGFQCRTGRIAGARVFEAAAQTSDTVLCERAARIDRRVHGPGCRVRAIAGVDRSSGEAVPAVGVGHRCRA